jgi:hypothetical protein
VIAQRNLERGINGFGSRVSKENGVHAVRHHGSEP